MNIRTGCVVLGLLIAASIGMVRSDGSDPDSDAIIRMGASTSLVSAEVNENDARAAIKTWADTFSRGLGFRLQYLPEVLSKPEDLLRKVRQGELDAFSATTVEYEQVAAFTDPSLLLVDQSYVNGGEEYVLLAHTDSGIRSVLELRGKTLVRYSGILMSISSDWLVTLLAASQSGVPEAFFGTTTWSGKMSRVVLPVFFRQADACLVTRRGFETMAEMNPQLMNKLRVIAISPKLVPVVVAFHKNCSSRQKERFRAAMTSLGDTPAGRQLLALFGSRKVIAADPSVLSSGIQLINFSSSIRSRAVGAKK